MLLLLEIIITMLPIFNIIYPFLDDYFLNDTQHVKEKEVTEMAVLNVCKCGSLSTYD